MRKLLLLSSAFLMVISQEAIAFGDSSLAGNDHNIKRSYGSIHIGFGFRHIALGTTQTIIFNNGWGFGYSYLANFYAAPNTPKDYQGGRTFFINTDPAVPRNKIFVHSLLLHKEFYTKSATRRFAVATGPSLNYYRFSYFKSIPQELYLLGILGRTGNYEISTEKATGYGFSIIGSMGFFRVRGFGIQLSAFGNINAEHSYGGIQFEILFGKVMDKRKRKRPNDFQPNPIRTSKLLP
ncbi:MAG: hypothetical protein V4722_22115 [Bacteroidota bacterium]